MRVRGRRRPTLFDWSVECPGLVGDFFGSTRIAHARQLGDGGWLVDREPALEGSEPFAVDRHRASLEARLTDERFVELLFGRQHPDAAGRLESLPDD